MKTIAISGSPRRFGNTDRLLQHALEGAKANGHETEFFRVEDMNIHPCRGCMACMAKGECIHHDDMMKIYKAIREADHVILGTPVYMLQMTAQLKTAIDRFMCLIGPDFISRLTHRPRVSMAVTYGSAPENAIRPYMEQTFKGMEMFGFELGELLLTGGNGPVDAVESKKDVMDRAYRLGRSL